MNNQLVILNVLQVRGMRTRYDHWRFTRTLRIRLLTEEL